jgi:two-component system response regulator RegA
VDLGADRLDELNPVERVLLVDDEELGLKSLVRDFVRAGLTPLTARTCASALDIVVQHRPRLAIVDLFLEPPDNGMRLVAEIKAFDPKIFVILVSAHMSVAHAVMAIRAGADDVFLKPFKAKQALHRMTGGPPPPELEIPTLEQIEWEHIARVLGDYNGNISHAAEALGVFRQSLQRKIQRHARVLKSEECEPQAVMEPDLDSEPEPKPEPAASRVDDLTKARAKARARRRRRMKK